MRRHRPSKRRAVHFAPPPPEAKLALPPTPQATIPQPTPLELLGPEALFENHIRKMPPAKKLYLAMLIMDDLQALAGKRKARRNQAYIVQALECANELAALPQPMVQVQEGAAPALEPSIDPPLLEE